MKRLLLPVIVMSMSGCSPSSTDDPVSRDTAGSGPENTGLENTDWVLRQYLDEAGELTPVLVETVVDARFSEGQIAGSAGCNRYFGPYTPGEDQRLTVGSEFGSTQMACPPPISRQEQRYLALLALVASWQRDGDALRLLDGDRQLLLEYAAAEPVPLTDTVWQATGINNGRSGVVSSETTHLATATFADGKISGSAGCNQFTASYEIEGDQIRIGRAATTRMHCAEPAGLMAQEQQYVEALARARTYALKRDKLELRDENGALQVGFRVRHEASDE